MCTPPTEKICEGVCPLCPISFLNDLDACDLENYKHPPFMWTLWYVCLAGKAIYDKVKELLGEGGGDSDGGDGGDGGKGGKDDKKEPPPKDEPPAEEQEEAPPEEEEG